MSEHATHETEPDNTNVWTCSIAYIKHVLQPYVNSYSMEDSITL